MIRAFRPKAALLLVVILLAMLAPSADVALAVQTASVTTELNYGVMCTTRVRVVSYGIGNGGNYTLHDVSCNQPVGRLEVKARQARPRMLPQFTKSATCYNTNYCMVTIEAIPFGAGTWVVSTSGIVGTLWEPLFYGQAATASTQIICYDYYCEPNYTLPPQLMHPE
ncbi:MAG TPA: hypothetical protein VFS21_35285 [Roseiflexaceae bacterium]|nr:hypothetical protein [Roseiflexaceae bacterium]